MWPRSLLASHRPRALPISSLPFVKMDGKAELLLPHHRRRCVGVARFQAMARSERYFFLGALSIAFASVVSGETYTDASCNAVVPTMSSCASRWDSIRTECTKSITTNTVWPGPCECGYYTNDLECFDEQALCAVQVWSQVPQWFRDGVTSCLMKDASYTIRAQLGEWQNPFLISGLAGNAVTDYGSSTSTRESRSTSAGSISSTSAQTAGGPQTVTVTAPTSQSPSTTASSEGPSGAHGMSNGAKIGLGLGLGLGVLMVSLVGGGLLLQKRRASAKTTTGGAQIVPELHGQDAHIFEVDSKRLYPENELAGDTGPWYDQSPVRHELESPTSRADHLDGQELPPRHR
ncbi:hypothetical protein EJ04DRAFT_122520 [Polyplosphaeria fusca]|uniref:Uncharacterized protein n=1 Tax=Polyplosphaeria fusca TaxID=682080 RepID=A0A9P4UTM7_9PLEO|nr:hypothetical protein EJ04DRAFT_122520 [Polyplosphaeria fusca]